VSSLDGLAAHCRLMVCFGGLPRINLQIEAGGNGVHTGALWLERMREAGIRIVCITPSKADVPPGAEWQTIRPNTDTAVMLAMAGVLLDQGLAGFTAGCVCIAPAISTAILAALKAGDRAEATRLLEPILPLEVLRNGINEIRVLHAAVALSGLAQTGPILRPSSDIPDDRRADVAEAARALLAAERAFRAA